MKKVIFVLVVMFTTVFYGQSSVSKDNNIEDLIHIWGLVKYKHPVGSSGKFDMNEEFLKAYEQVVTIETPQVLNAFFLAWINTFNDDKNLIKKEGLDKAKLFTDNAKYDWIENPRFNDSLKQVLRDLRDNTNLKFHYAKRHKVNKMIDFLNENKLDGYTNTNAGHRALLLSSFWNMMKYWNINLYLTDTPWDEVLTRFMPLFENTEGKEFEYTKEKLFVALNDSHSNYEDSQYLKDNFKFYPAFNGKVVNDSIVVYFLQNTAITTKEGIDLGDIIYSIDGLSVKKYLQEKVGAYVSVSNDSYLKKYYESFLFLASSKDKIIVEVKKKDGRLEKKEVSLYKFNSMYDKDKSKSLYKEQEWNLEKEIGYISLATITRDELKKAFEKYKDTKGIIINLRNYPQNIRPNDIAKYLLPEKKKFISVLGVHSPGYGEKNQEFPLNMIIDPFVVGGKNKNYYKGKVVLLVDGSTGSNAEFIAMAIQQSPNCITVGEQTFGAVMNRIVVPLLDGTSIDFTGNSAYYPGDEKYNIQRNGLKIDHKVSMKATDYDIYTAERLAVRLLESE